VTVLSMVHRPTNDKLAEQIENDAQKQLPF
jgi:hypothetical protein